MPPDLPNRDSHDPIQSTLSMLIGTVGFGVLAAPRSGNRALMAFGFGGLSLICAGHGFCLFAALKR